MTRTSNGFTKRAISLLLTLVMVVGLMPTSVFGMVSGGQSGSTVPPTGSAGSYNWVKGYGSFTRFTIVEINAPDDTTTYQNGHEPLPELNPYSTRTDFLYGSGMAVNRENYKVLGSVMIGSTSNPVVDPAHTTWYDTNAVEYCILCEENQTVDGRLSAVYNYLANSAKTGLSQSDFYTWDEFVSKHSLQNKTGTSTGLFPFANQSGGDLTSLWATYGNYEVGGDNDSYGSMSDFGYALFQEICPDVWNQTYHNSLMGRDLSIVFDFAGDMKCYRIIAEDGVIIKRSGQTQYYAMTARDFAAIGVENTTLVEDVASIFKNTQTGLTDNYPQPYGYYAKPNDSGGYDTVTVDSINGALWSSGTTEASRLPSGWKAKRNLIFGINSSGTAILTENADGRNPYPSLGLAVLTPMQFDIATIGLTIRKNVTNIGDEYASMEWQFKVTLEIENMELATGPFKVTVGDEKPVEFTTVQDLFEYLKEPLTIKSGQSIVIEGLPEGTKYTVEELVDGQSSGGDSDDEADVMAVDGSEDDEFNTYVTDSGAENTERVESTITNGTIPENGIASVNFENTFPGGPAHLIVDYNLPGATATYDEKLGAIVSDDTVECGTHNVGDRIPIKAAFNGTPLVPNQTQIQIGTMQGEPIYATFLGLFDGFDSSATMLDYEESSGTFYWTLNHEDLTVIYARWSIGDVSIDPIPPDPQSANWYYVFFDSNYDGGPSYEVLTGTYKYTGSLQVGGMSGTYDLEVKIPWNYPDPPQREGWMFAGWSLDPQGTSGDLVPSDPGQSDTYYGVWEAEETIWDANGGTFEEGTQMYFPSKVYPRGEIIGVLDTEPTREGYTFNGWYLDPACTQPLEGYEEGVQPGRTYYAGWTAERVIVTYYDTRDGTGVLETQYYNYDDILNLFTGMDSTVGWDYDDWNTSFDGSGMTGADAQGKYLNTTDFGDLLVYHEGAAGPTEPDPEDPGVMSDRGYWTLDFYAQWKEKTATYNVQIVWNDYENNDGARPTEIELGLVDSYNNNTIIERFPVTGGSTDETWSTQIDLAHITDNDSSLQKRTYKIVFLGYTDIRNEKHVIQAPAIDGQEGTMELAAPSLADASYGVNTLYSYGVNNYAPDYTGTGEYDTVITYNHSLITTGDDIQFTIDWDDDNDNDGVRPGSVMLVLYANGVPVSEFPMHNAYTGEVQVSAAMCDVANDGDTWTYTFKDYQRYNDGEAIDYTVAIKNPDKTTTFNLNGYTTTYIDTNGDSEIGDHNGCTVSRPIELHEVPFSIVWDDENNRDGQRPEFVSVSLMSYQWNDHTYQWEYVEMATQTVHSDAVNTMTAGEWTGVFELDADSLKYPVYHDGLEAIYHLVVTSDLNAFIPEGSFEYGWIESAYGNQKKVTPQVIISQNTNTVSVTANVYWNDSQNNDDIRPENVILQLYSHAPGEEPVAVPGAAYRVTISGDEKADNWYYTFSGMPKYADGHSGVEIKLYPVAYRL